MVPPPIHTHQHHKHCIWKTFSFPVFYFFLWFWIYSLLNTYSVRICFQYWRINFPPTFTHSSVVCVCFWFVLKFKWQKFFSVFFSVQSPHKHITKSDFFSPRWFSVPVDLNKARKNFFYWQNIIWWFFLSDNFFYWSTKMHEMMMMMMNRLFFSIKLLSKTHAHTHTHK